MTRTSTARMVATMALLLGVAACSDDSDPDDPGTSDAGASETGQPSETTESTPTESSEPSEPPADDRSPDEALEAATDATLGATKLSVDGRTDLQVGGTKIALTTQGRVDYDATIVDVDVAVEQDGAKQQVTILADGTTAWIAATGSQVPPFPDGATYVAGDAAKLQDADSFTQADLIGLVYVLRAGDDAEAGEAGEADGVATRSYSFTVPYADAVEAAGADAEAFQSALNLTGDGEQADLEVDVEVGADDVVRSLTLDIDAGDLPLGGGAELTLSDVGQDVEPPEAPADDEVATGPEADALLDQLLA